MHLSLDDKRSGVIVDDDERLTVAGGALLPVERRSAIESYALELPLQGPATITAPTALGLFRGLATFEQLFYRLNEDEWLEPQRYIEKKARAIDDSGAIWAGLRQTALMWLNWGQVMVRRDDAAGDQEASRSKGRLYAPFAPYRITDQSSFGWRGLMLDTARHWFPVSVIERVCRHQAGRVNL